jgi:hypothetical protein
MVHDIPCAGCETAYPCSQLAMFDTPLTGAQQTFLQAKKAPEDRMQGHAPESGIDASLARSSGRKLDQQLFEGLFSRSVSGLNGFIEGR